MKACSTDMWRGVNVNPLGKFNTDQYGNTRSAISDAEYAVTANHLSKSVLQHTDFTNNYVSLYIPPMSQFNYNAVELKNLENTYSTDGLDHASLGRSILIRKTPMQCLVPFQFYTKF